MMTALHFVLLAFGFVFFMLCGMGIPGSTPPPPPWPVRLIAWGLAFWIATVILATLPGTH